MSVYDRPLTIEQNQTLLSATPARIADLTEGLSPALLLTPPEPGAWSARDVLAHLRTCADMWGKYLGMILSEHRPMFYHEQAFQPSLQAFTAQRAELLTLLQPLAPESWSRTGLVTGAGKPRERTVQMYAQWLANHEQSHIRQIERIVNSLRI